MPVKVSEHREVYSTMPVKVKGGKTHETQAYDVCHTLPFLSSSNPRQLRWRSDIHLSRGWVILKQPHAYCGD